TLFELPTVAGLAGAVETALRVGQKINRPPILRVPRGAKILPSIAQELLLLLDELVPSNHLFNIPRAYRLTGPLDLLALGRSLNAVVARHEAFRTSFPTVDGEWIQFIAPSITLNLNVTDLQRFPQSQREPEMRALAREEKTQSFDLVNGPLLRVKLFQTGPEQHVLLTTFHHIITDGWSINVFFQDLAAFYEAFSRDRQPFLAELPIQFADFSSWQRQALADDWMLNQLAYWEEQLKSPLTVLELVTNRRRSSELSFLTARTPVSVTGDVFDSLKKLSREEMSTLFMTVLSALKILLYAHSGQEDIRVGTLVANRDWGETDKLIGHFVNTLIIRTRINAGSSFRQLQRDVRHTTLEAQARQSLPFETLLRSLERATNLNRSALAQVMFVYQMTTSNSF